MLMTFCCITLATRAVFSAEKGHHFYLVILALYVLVNPKIFTWRKFSPFCHGWIFYPTNFCPVLVITLLYHVYCTGEHHNTYVVRKLFSISPTDQPCNEDDAYTVILLVCSSHFWENGVLWKIWHIILWGMGIFLHACYRHVTCMFHACHMLRTHLH